MHRCPICQNEAAADGTNRPFCSERCKKVDLGRWLNEDYRISRPATLDELAALPGREQFDEVAYPDADDEM